MGFAYAQGFIEQVNNFGLTVDWSGYYIFAPENGSADAINTGLTWEEYYQYGSNLGQTNADKKWLQDGVAPQFGVGNMQGHRVFIPDKDAAGNDVPKGYTDSHSIGNYGWVFKILFNQSNQLNGHVSSK